MTYSSFSLPALMLCMLAGWICVSAMEELTLASKQTANPLSEAQIAFVRQYDIHWNPRIESEQQSPACDAESSDASPVEETQKATNTTTRRYKVGLLEHVCAFFKALIIEKVTTS